MAGFFWDDTPPPKAPKAEKAKTVPPERHWERPDYLPGLAEALRFNVNVMTDSDLVMALMARERLAMDIESYRNYFLVAFRSVKTGKVLGFEILNDGSLPQREKLEWILKSFCIVTFNGINYDMPILAIAMAGHGPAVMKEATNLIIQENYFPYEVLRKYKVKALQCDHIDLIEVVPLRTSLKVCGGRMHTQRMQDLPFPHEATLSLEQMAIVRWYCVNDLVNTVMLVVELEEEISLRESMSREYGMDLRSRSDAQIAESVIGAELEALSGHELRAPVIEPGTRYFYRAPSYLKYSTPLMQWVLQTVCSQPLYVNEKGKIGLPALIKVLPIRIGESSYTMGIGGLHSKEKRSAHMAGDDYVLKDRDVTSFYPFIILNQQLFPQHLGPNFLRVYKSIVDRRLHAKANGMKVIADSLKITINGSFGKFGNRFSKLYAPDLLIQVTLTGQLSLLMLIERLELAGISVVSANTDGIVIKCHKSREHLMEAIVKQWEDDTGFTTEETDYAAIYSKDVNNYIAVYKNPKKNKDGSVEYAKTKGVYAEPGLRKNPVSRVCATAAIAQVAQGIPVEQTVRSCTDIRQFACVRTVKNGAVKVWGDGRPNDYLGKSIRWYYSTEVSGAIVDAKKGGRIGTTESARPMMELVDHIPADLDFDYYIAESRKILSLIGYDKNGTDAEELDEDDVAEEEADA